MLAALKQFLRVCNQRASRNVSQWGRQDTETLLLAMEEELGELTQAHLESVHGDGDHERVATELADLTALCFQLAAQLKMENDP